MKIRFYIFLLFFLSLFSCSMKRSNSYSSADDVLLSISNKIAKLDCSPSEAGRLLEYLKARYIELGASDIFLQHCSKRSAFIVLGTAPRVGKDSGFGQTWFSNSGGEAMVAYVGADSGGNFSHFDIYLYADFSHDFPFLKKSEIGKLEWNYVDTKKFSTMRGVQLGMDLNEVIAVYGTNYMRISGDKQKVSVCYSNWYFGKGEIINTDNNGYYNSEYEFVSNRLRKISFGFNTYI